MSQNGKGDGSRPCFIPKEQLDKNYELAFGKKIPWWERRNNERDTTPERTDPHGTGFERLGDQRVDQGTDECIEGATGTSEEGV